MNFFCKTFTILSVVVHSVNLASLPNYIIPCKKNDPEINECARQHAQDALPSLLKGDKSIKLPSLLPYKVPSVDIDQGENLKLHMDNVEITGLDGVKFTGANIDLKNKLIQLKGEVPLVSILGQYEINGRILILPIVGKGPANITFSDLKFDYKLKYTLEKQKDGREYVKVDSSTLDFDTKRSWFKFENLFNGDKVLGEQMATFMDENWREVGKDLNPVLSDTVNAIITHILKVFITKVPYDELFVE